MQVYPLKSMTIEEATEKQFELVEAITREFSGSEILTRGDLGVHPSGNIPQTTRKVEKVLARFFNQEDAIFVRGSGTAAIREALAAIVKNGDKVLVHLAPIYTTTITTLKQLGITTITCDFNDMNDVKDALSNNKDLKAVLIQYTRQTLEDHYDMDSLIHEIKTHSEIPIITD